MLIRTVGILSLTAGLYFILQMWHRSGTVGECHNCIRSSCYCCNDSGRSRNGKGDDYDAPEDKKIQKKYCLTKAKWDELDLGARIGYRARYRVKKIFIGIMDAIGVFVLVVGVLLIQWVDSANGEEDIGYQMSVSPTSYVHCRVFNDGIQVDRTDGPRANLVPDEIGVSGGTGQDPGHGQK
jgi:hypothetical protein